MLWKCQCSTREYLQITGSSLAVSKSDLIDVVCWVINKVGVVITDNDIEDCHCVSNRWQTNVKFCWKKICKQLLGVKQIQVKLQWGGYVHGTGGN